MKITFYNTRVVRTESRVSADKKFPIHAASEMKSLLGRPKNSGTQVDIMKYTAPSRTSDGKLYFRFYPGMKGYSKFYSDILGEDVMDAIRDTQKEILKNAAPGTFTNNSYRNLNLKPPS